VGSSCRVLPDLEENVCSPNVSTPNWSDEIVTVAAYANADRVGSPRGIPRAEIGRAAASHGGLVLITGEAGIGKTTLVTDAAEHARGLGALVLSGTCWDSDSAPGYWPAREGVLDPI
jgi:hypothetical protein